MHGVCSWSHVSLPRTKPQPFMFALQCGSYCATYWQGGRGCRWVSLRMNATCLCLCSICTHTHICLCLVQFHRSHALCTCEAVNPFPLCLQCSEPLAPSLGVSWASWCGRWAADHAAGHARMYSARTYPSASAHTAETACKITCASAHALREGLCHGSPPSAAWM